MCLEAPGLIISCDDDYAVIESKGRRRRATTLLYPDLRAGEWVLVSAGTVISRLDEAAATELQAAVDVARGDAA
jgi:hydrogenase assembly chaperone HypC/HupF